MGCVLTAHTRAGASQRSGCQGTREHGWILVQRGIQAEGESAIPWRQGRKHRGQEALGGDRIVEGWVWREKSKASEKQ